LSRADDEVAQQALMVLKVADDPHAAMDEEQHTRLSVHMLGLHDVQLNGAPILRDGPSGRGDTRHVDRRF